MTAVEPWSGHYEVMGPIWIAGVMCDYLSGYYTTVLYTPIHMHTHTHTHTSHTHTHTLTAHTTQFSEIGHYYLKHGYGAGHLSGGGSYVTLYDPETKHFSIIIETMVSGTHTQTERG